MSSGRLAAFHGPGKPMELLEFPLPEVEPGAALVRTTIANVCGTDLHQWRGEFDIARFGRPYPQVLGHEMTGTIARLGAGLTHDSAGAPLQTGDRVVFRYFSPCGRCRACLKGATRACPEARGYLRSACTEPPHFNGAFGDYYYVRPGTSVFRVPDNLSDEVVAGVNCALGQVVGGLGHVGIELGDTVVIQGAGGLGLFAIAVAREMGAGRIIVLDALDDRLELAQAFGADETISLRATPDADARVRRVRAATGGWGADVVVDLAGHPSAVPEGLAMLGRGGHHLEIGCLHPGTTVPIEVSDLVFRNITVHANFYYEPADLARAIDLLSRTRDAYPWPVVATAPFALDEINDAFRAAGRGAVPRASIVP